jgi:hypothetical protein
MNCDHANSALKLFDCPIEEGNTIDTPVATTRRVNRERRRWKGCRYDAPPEWRISQPKAEIGDDVRTICVASQTFDLAMLGALVRPAGRPHERHDAHKLTIADTKSRSDGTCDGG